MSLRVFIEGEEVELTVGVRVPAKTAREAKIIIADIEIRDKSFLLFINGNYIRDWIGKQ